MSYPAVLHCLLAEFHLTSGQVLAAITFSSSALLRAETVLPSSSQLYLLSSFSVFFFLLFASPRPLLSPPLLLLVCVKRWCQVEEWSKLMGRWRWEGNKAVSCEHFHPPLSLFHKAYPKKKRDFSLVSPAKMPYQPLINIWKTHLLNQTFKHV